MVSYETLMLIHQRLTEIKGSDDTEVYFGGLNIIAVGYFYPFCDRFVFQNSRDICQHLRIYGEIYLEWWTPYKYATKE